VITKILEAGVAAASRVLDQRRTDGWANTVAGLGPGTDDRSQAWVHTPNSQLSWDVLAAAFEDDDVVAAGASRVPDAIVGRGFDVASDETDPEQLADLNDELTDEDRLDALAVYHRALIWEQLFGGAAILIGAEDGRPVDEPLDVGAVERVHFLLDLDPREVQPHQSALSLQPSHYRVQVGTYLRTVHRSRLVLFKGLPLPRRERQRRQGWGASRIERAWDVIRQYHASWAAANHAMIDSSQAVYKIKGLADMIIAGQESVIRARVALTNMMRSLARAIILDKDHEEFERKDSNMTGMADVLEQRYQRLAQALEMPVTVLVGMSPAGLNATGESDVRLWYDRIAQDRGRYFTPRLGRTVDLVMRSRSGPTRGVVPRDWTIEFESLWLETEREDAEVDDLQVKTLTAAVALGVDKEAAIARATEVLELSGGRKRSTVGRVPLGLRPGRPTPGRPGLVAR
jgi:phage-related protein (TIGR01555 family)